MMHFIQDINFRKGKTIMEGDIVEMGKYIGPGLRVLVWAVRPLALDTWWETF
jgi:hypothetical protein